MDGVLDAGGGYVWSYQIRQVWTTSRLQTGSPWD